MSESQANSSLQQTVASSDEPEGRDGLSLRFSVSAARELSDLRCEEVMVLDVRGLSSLCDYVVLGTGTSDRQAKASAKHVADLGKEMGLARLASDADATSKWVVVDFAGVMVHVFEPATRAYYDLEMLWGDAPRVPWRRLTSPGDGSGGEGDHR